MQVLFTWDSHGADDAAMAEHVLHQTGEESLRSPALEMARGAWSQRQIIDIRLERVAPQWPPRRQPGVDRAILRLSLWELTNMPTPPKVVIDEAIELSKSFSTENSPAFVNGVLDAVMRENAALLAHTTPTEQPSDTKTPSEPAAEVGKWVGDAPQIVTDARAIHPDEQTDEAIK